MRLGSSATLPRHFETTLTRWFRPDDFDKKTVDAGEAPEAVTFGRYSAKVYKETPMRKSDGQFKGSVTENQFALPR